MVGDSIKISYMSQAQNAPMIIVHDLVQARAVLAVASQHNRPVLLRSPETTSAAIGPAIFVETTKLARASYPKGFAGAIFDCGAEAGLAIAAIRYGDCHIIVNTEPETTEKIKKLAEAKSVTALDKRTLEDRGFAVLDLKDAKSVSSTVEDFLKNIDP